MTPAAMSQTVIDLRSDTVTLPCEGMRRAMARAEVGDDVYDEDPTVRRLQARLAEMAGHEAGLFFPSGTQSNLVALLSHCQRGEEFIVGQEAHTYKYEGGGAAVLGSIQPQPIELSGDGTMPLEKIRAAIKDDDVHFAITRLLALENTIGGRIISQDYIAAAGALARENGLSFHLDGARVFNAAVYQRLALADIAGPFDSVSICLSKGLGAPAGSVLVASKALIEQARRWRKMVGGGMRQVGVLAGACEYALDHNIDRLADDHALADRLAQQLMGVEGLRVEGGGARTNMVFLSCTRNDGLQLLAWCRDRGLIFGGRDLLRLVVHKDIDPGMIDRAGRIIRDYFSST